MVQPVPSSDKRPPPLAGRRVLDLSRVLAGPWCTMILADLGAEVIKVENPRGGDDTRHWGPPYAGGESAYYLCANRNKQSIAIDLSNAEGQGLVRMLAARSDVLVENYKLGDLDRYGLDYGTIAAINPAIIYCSISGYGRASPLAARPGYDFVIQAEAGLMAVTGEPGHEPMRAGVAVADLFTGMAAAQAILAALIARDRDGVGQQIDMALYDCQLAMLANVGSAALVSGVEPGRYGNAHPAIVPYQLFRAADGELVIAVGNDRQFASLAALIGQPQLSGDPRFSTNASRVENRGALLNLLEPAIAARPVGFWLEALRRAGIPCGEVRGPLAALGAPETTGRAMVRDVAHPTIGTLSLIASPLRFAGTPVADPVAPPLLNEHADSILRDVLGLDDAAIMALREAGAMGRH